MKLGVVAASLLASVNSQTPTPKLSADCVTENSIEQLVIDVPYPNSRTANLLHLVAGNCDVTSYLTAGGNYSAFKDLCLASKFGHF